MNLPCLILGLWCSSGTIAGPAYVHDGDTIYIDHQAVRLAGIDAEELDEANGPRARDHLRQLIAGHVVTCEWQGWSYARRIGTCSTTSNLNAQMVIDGYALDCARYSGGAYRQFEPPGIRQRLTQKGYC